MKEIDFTRGVTLVFSNHFSNREIAAKILGDSHDLHFKENGAPFLVPNDLFISMSGTKGAAVVAISKQKIGVDIQGISLRPRIAKKLGVATPEEFTIKWTKFEAFSKWTEKGIFYEISSALPTSGFFSQKIDDYYISVYQKELNPALVSIVKI
jgi:phosphopantetheinyl transferase